MNGTERKILQKTVRYLSVVLGLCGLVMPARSFAANIYLSDMIETSGTVGWGTLQYDRSIGGNTITINGTVYARGLGAHAQSTIIYNLNKNFTSFTSDVGVDGETSGNGTVQFQVFVDDVLAYDSGVMNGTAAAKKVTVSVAGKNTLKLVVNDGGDGISWDHADWAGARLVPVDSSYVLDNIKIACVGNSITQGDGLANPATQGYVALVQKMFGTKCRVLNYGISGRTMLKNGDYPYWRETRFGDLFTVKPDIITIMLGTNDSKPWNWTTAATYTGDYAAFIDTLMTIRDTNPSHAPHPQILLCLPPPAGTNSYSISGTVIATQIIPAVRALAQTKGDLIVDANLPFLPKMSMVPDGVHPDSNGNKVLADVFYETLQNCAFKQSPRTRWLWYGSAPGALGNADVDKPMLYAFPAPDSNRNGAAVIICPGGGYTGLPVMTTYEGFDEAKWFNTYGVTAFVLRYRYSPYRHPIELNDAKRAMRTVRYYAAAYGLDTTKIGIMGFSAGGHLASTLGTHFDGGAPADLDPIQQKKSRPDFLVLIYPVITLQGWYAHTGSRDALLGVPANSAQVDSLSNQKWVTAQTPPTFLAHGDADNTVPIQNSRMFDSACKANHVPDTLVVDPGKNHGYGMAGIWPPILINWMRLRGIIATPTIVDHFTEAALCRAPLFSLRYSPAEGIHIAVNAPSADRIEIFSTSGRRFTVFAAAPGAGDYYWKPSSQGVYIVRSRAGIAKINCTE